MNTTTDDNVEYFLNDAQMLLLCMRADPDGRAEDVRAEMIEVIKAWWRGRLLSKHKTPILCELYSDFGRDT